jgi:predicted MFS family arabinose efflux permease
MSATCPLRRNAALLVVAALLSGFGGTAMMLVAGVWALDLTGSSSLAALVGVGVYAPVLAAPWLGAIVDRLPRQRMLVVVHCALAVTLFALFAVRSAEQVWLLFVVTLAYGITFVVVDAGDTALQPDAVRPDVLAVVNGWRASAQEGIKLVAPAAGAALYAWQGGRPVVVLTALTLLAVAVLYAAVRVRQPARASGRDDEHGGVLAGWGLLREDPTMCATVALAATAIAMSGFTTAALYAVVTDVLDRPAAFLGVLMSAQGGASLVGGLLMGRCLRAWQPTGVGVLGVCLFAAGCLARAVPLTTSVVAGSALVGLGLPWVLVAAVTAVQTSAPPSALGRVAATANSVMFAPLALATPVGAAAVHLGAVPVLLAAALTCCALALATVRSRRGAVRERA